VTLTRVDEVFEIRGADSVTSIVRLMLGLRLSTDSVKVRFGVDGAMAAGDGDGGDDIDGAASTSMVRPLLGLRLSLDSVEVRFGVECAMAAGAGDGGDNIDGTGPASSSDLGSGNSGSETDDVTPSIDALG
jgi:hypothetical protein